MAYVTPGTKYAGSPGYTAGDINTWLRDNYLSMAPDVFTAKGDIYAATAADAGAKVAVGSNDMHLHADSSQPAGVRWLYDACRDAIGAKGDLFAGSAADAVVGVTVGVNNSLLVCDSSQTSGLAWRLWRYADALSAKGAMIAASASNTPASVVPSSNDNNYLTPDSNATAGVYWQFPWATRLINPDITPFDDYSSGSWTRLQMDTLVYGGANYDANYHYWSKTVQEPGFYLIGAFVTFESTTAISVGEVVALRCVVNTVDIGLFGMTKYSATMANCSPSVNGMIIAELAANDTVGVEVYQDSGATLTIEDVDAASFVFFHRLGGR